jgi:hypothetical protein
VHSGARSAAAACVLLVAASAAHAQVYKCTDASGRTTYADAPCASGSKPLTIQPDAKANVANATACEQLLDETRRLAAEADRDAKRGRPKNAANAKRHQALTAQYQRRCVGISRSP